MKPELRRFFDSMGRYFQNPDQGQALFAEHPGWTAAPARVGIYGRFVYGHVQDILDKLYPLCRAAVPEGAWHQLTASYYASRPARHFEINRAGESFPEFLASQVDGKGLPKFLPALARFEWTDFAVYASTERIPPEVSSLTPNPTLSVLQHPYSLCEFVRTPPPRPAAPSAGQELALLWRHPSKETTHFLAADPPALLVLKMAVEQIPVERAVEESRLSTEQIQQWIRRFAEDGMVLSP